MSSKSNVTIQDVARAANVSVSTVSRVLNDKDDVADATYKRVQRTIDELGYTSSLAARSMRSDHTRVIGLIALDLDDPFVIELLKGINDAIQSFGYDLILYASGAKAKLSRAEWERRHVSLINGSIADGVIIVTPTAITLPSTAPLIAVDPHKGDTDYPAVIATNRKGARQMTEYLIQLGHRRIGFIAGREGLKSAEQRLRGYKDALNEAGIPFSDYLVEPGDYRRQMGFISAQKLLNLRPRPTAIFAANDESAIGTIEAARQEGLRIPRDLSVAGFDDLPQAAYLTPSLSTVSQSIPEMGRIATKRIIRLIDGETLRDRVRQVPTELIIRHSCRPLNQTASQDIQMRELE